MRSVISFVITMGVAMILVSCFDSEGPDERFEKLADRYIEKYLQYYPESATELGDHRYDRRMNDYSLAGVKESLALSKSYLDSLELIEPEELRAANRIDYLILKNRLELMVFRLEILREYEWNPLVYNVGGAIYSLIARDFAPLSERMACVKERLRVIPQITAMAKANLENPPAIHTETAILQNKGTIALIRDDLDGFIDDAPRLMQELQPFRDVAIDALEYYGSWLERDLLPVSKGDFRLGEEKYRRKLQLVLQSRLTMEEILERAERDLIETREEMYRTALPLYKDYYPDAAASDLSDEKKVIRAVLDRLADSHPTNETIVDRARESLARCTDFTVSNDLVTLPRDPIRLIVMPEFQRGIAVAYCDAPGPLEENAETFFAIAPTPKDWTEERVMSFFREYNEYMLHELTIHEAMPGHYVQLAHANRFRAPTKIRAVFPSGPFVEGWATYAEELMAELDYMGPELRMQQMKMRLRMIINVIIDQKIHTQGMSKAQAMDLMMNEGFQEEGEATGKWRRACLTSTQLSTYYVGNIEMNEIRRAYEGKNGRGGWKAMHDEMLSFGSPPPKYLKMLMGLQLGGPVGEN